MSLKNSHVLLCGVQGSGKTHRANALKRTHFVIHLDDVVQELRESPLGYSEKRQFERIEQLIQEGCKQGRPIAYDSVGHRTVNRRNICQRIAAHSAIQKLTILHLETDCHVCLQRNAMRANPVPEWNIISIHNHFEPIRTEELETVWQFRRHSSESDRSGSLVSVYVFTRDGESSAGKIAP